jgi:SAM-dependent methyltransferase
MADPPARDYDAAFRDFDSPLRRRLRAQAYGEDIGQHSWVTADELRADLPRLELGPGSRLLDLGCGPCGPLTFLLRESGCRGTGVDRSRLALESGRRRAGALGVGDAMTVHEADLDAVLPFDDGSFDAAMALDIVLHVEDRERLFADVARVVAPGGRFLFTDAAVLAGPITREEKDARSAYGRSRFAEPGDNERALEAAGWTLVETEDRTGSVVRNASGRLEAALAHRAELEEMDGPDEFERRARYLVTVIELARRGALLRLMYLAVRKPRPRGTGGAG